MFFCFLQQCCEVYGSVAHTAGRFTAEKQKNAIFQTRKRKDTKKKTASLHLNIQKGYLSRDTPKIQMKKLCLTKI